MSREPDAAALLQRADSEKAAISLQAELSAKRMSFATPARDSFRVALQQAGFYNEWKTRFGPAAWGRLEASVGRLT